MERPAIELVLQALDALYRNDDVSEKEKASQWLMQLQASVHAWEVADQLLLLKRDMETSYFAAQTMQSKVRFSFDELPPETHMALRDSLLNHLHNLSDAPSPIVRQLAMALADLALQMSEWNTVVPDIIGRFGGSLATVNVLLDILIVLPEELGNRALRLGHNRRKELRELLGKSCADVLSLLVLCLSSSPNSPDLHTRVYACLGSWVLSGNFPVKELAQSPLIAAPFQTLQLLEVPQKLYEAAADSICATLFVCEDVTRYYPLAVAMKSHVQQLLPVYQASVQAEDSDRAYCLCRIFTEMAESFLLYTIHHPNTELGDLQMFDHLLECVGHPDYEVADITFNVWYRLSEELLKLGDDPVLIVFKPYVQRLVSHICVHCQLDEDTSPTTVPDEKDDFSDFRNSVVELLRDVIFMVGSLGCFIELYANICKPGTAWNVTEACLFVMHALAPSIRLDESENLPIAVPVLLSISPDTHYAIRATTLKLVADLAEWINTHPDTLDLVLRFLLDGLRIPPVATLAAKAVQSICQKCKDKMAPHFDGLVQIIEAADNLGIANDAIVGLLKGAGDVLSEMPHDQITAGVRSLCMLQARPLSQLAQGTLSVQSGTSSDPSLWMDRLTAVFRACQVGVKEGQQHPCQPVVEELWPVMSSVCTKFQEDQRIIERTCRCLRFMIRSIGKFAASILSPLVTLMVSIYRDHHHSCFLYLGSIIVDEFGTQESYQQGLLGMLLAFAEVSFPFLSGPTGLINHPDTVDDMYRLCARFLQRSPVVFLSTPMAPTAIHCALAACTLNHRDGFTSVMKFLRDLIHLPLEEGPNHTDAQFRLSAVQTFLTQNGEVLMDGLVSGFINLPSFMIAESTEVLWELIKYAREPACQLLKASIEKASSSCNQKVTVEQQSAFLDSVAKCTELDDLYPIIKDLARLYR